MPELRKQIREATKFIRKAYGGKPKIGIILGTGLGGLAGHMKVETKIAYAAIPHFPTSSLEGHAGELIAGTLSNKPVLALSGRFHVYEGCSLREATFPVRVAKALGVKTLIVSNAAGGLNPLYRAGDLMLIDDHINFMGDNPLIGYNDEALGPRFPDMSEPYDRKLMDLAESIARAQGIKLHRGVYLACPGPSLETRAEYRFMRQMGADVVGMSTVPEVIVAVHAGMKVLGFSAVTDECFPDALKPVDVEKIIATAMKAEPALTELVKACIAKMK